MSDERYCVKESYSNFIFPHIGIITKIWTFWYNDGTFERLTRRVPIK